MKSTVQASFALDEMTSRQWRMEVRRCRSYSSRFIFLGDRKMKLLFTLAVACGLMSASLANAAVDADSAQALLKKSDCLKCHAVDKKKDGPSFKETAKKYKGKADAEDKLVKHLTTKPMIEIDGKKEEHKALKSTDSAEVKNVVQWILAQ
jgi:cytochrome c